MNRFLQTIIAFAVLAAMAVAIVWLEAGNQTFVSGVPVVIDGDSLEINGERLRLQGIDAPELAQTCERNGAVWPCGRRSRAVLRDLVATGLVSCRTMDIDKYDRWLVECEVEGVSINETMVENGWAIAYGGYRDAEDKAREQGSGIWSGTFERPRQWRGSKRGGIDPASISVLRTAWMRVKRLVNSAFGL